MQCALNASLGNKMEDFEDALIMVCAEKANIDFIITRDEIFLTAEKAVSPPDFLKNY